MICARGRHKETIFHVWFKWFSKTLVDRHFVFQEKPRWFRISCPFILITFCLTKIIDRYHMCDCQLIFPLSPFLSPQRKTLQLNRTGATESPVFPQADFSGNYFSLLAFAGPLGIHLFFFKLQLMKSCEFHYASCFSWSHRYVPKMQHLSACEVSSAMLRGFLNVHTLTRTTVCVVCTHASLPTCTLTLGHSIVFLRQSCAAESLPSWQLWSVQVWSYFTHWAGLAWWAVGHRGGGLTNS